MKALPFWGNSIGGKSFAVSRQRRLNCYVEQRKDKDKDAVIMYGTPGLKLALALPSMNNTPARQIYGTDSAFYAVAYNQFISLDSSGNALFTATLSSTYGPASMIASGTQLLIVDGTSAYVYNGSTLSVVSGFTATGALTCTYVQGFFIAEQPGSQNFWTSAAPTGGGATTWNALAFAQASQFPDNISAVDNSQGNLVIFGQQHMEFWQNVGASPMPFQAILGATNQWGLPAIFSRAQVANTIIFLGESPQGTRHVCRLNGLYVDVISTPDLDYILAHLTRYDDAVALSYVTDGHPMYQITFPTDGRTFFFDSSTEFWNEAQTGISATPVRHQAQFSCYAQGRTVLSDYQNGNIYTIDSNQYTDNGVPIQREIISRHISQDTNVIGIDELYVDMETGVGLSTGQGSAPMMMMQTAKDGGQTWGIERWAPVGAQGNYINRVGWRRLGSGRDFVIRLRYTEPTKFVIAGVKSSPRERSQ